MDPFTQGVLGASAAQAIAKKTNIKYATLCGVIGGMVADLDVLIKHEGDPLLAFVYHRHFTHSLAFSPIGALIVALMLWPFIKKKLSFLHVWLFSFIGYLTHPILDSCTSYGTHLFWPFTNARTAWDFISIIDPIYTIPIFIGVVMAFFMKNRRPAIMVIIISSLYMAFGAAQHERAKNELYKLVEARKHKIEHYRVLPTFANMLVWRAVYKHNGRIYMDGVRVGKNAEIYKGGSVKAFEKNMVKAPNSSELEKDIDRFYFFADGLVGYVEGQKDVLGDYRYSPLPQETLPFWGIRIYPKRPAVHADFIRLATRDGKIPVLWDMIIGNFTRR